MGIRTGLKLLRCLCFSFAVTAFAQAEVSGQTRPVIGLHHNTPQVTALQNARVVVAPGRVLPEATVVVRHGRVAAVGKTVAVPPDAVVRELKGKTVYPGFIDLYTNYGISEEKEKTEAGDRTAAHWNPAVRAQVRSAGLFIPDKKQAESFRKNGFTAVASFAGKGIFRGSGCLVLLADTTADRTILAEDVAQAVSFNKGPDFPRGGVEGYPNSLKGHIALIRQSFLDARWYEQAWKAYSSSPSGQQAPERNPALDALGPCASGQIPVLFTGTSTERDLFRAAKLKREFALSTLALATGYEYRRLEALKAASLKLIVPLDFPKPPDVSSAAKERDISLRQLKHWDLAAENPARLWRAGVNFALTAAKLSKAEDFLKNLRTAVRRGLPPEAALAGLTTTPAEWLSVSDHLGTIETGKLANFVITDGDLFDTETEVVETWVAGIPYEIAGIPLADLSGSWELGMFSQGAVISARLEIEGKSGRLKAEIESGGKKIKAREIALEKRMISLVFPGDSLGKAGIVRMSGTVGDKTIQGRIAWPDGEAASWHARLASAGSEKPDTAGRKQEKAAAEFPVVFPDGAFGRTGLPSQPKSLLVRGATLWTCGPKGIIENADLLVSNGRIISVGAGLEAPQGTVVVRAEGKHITPGLIDTHSHIAIEGGVNESSHAITSEVRIEDVINCDDINIYRHLAGGITSSLTIHGSANPIGGEAALIKMRWGALAGEMLFRDSKPVIKFALGENVTQANRPNPARYPATRMGVEQFYRDWFAAAKDYRKAWEQYNREKKKKPGLVPPRRDLRLEPLLDVLDGKMTVHCHSYRQDEILAMLRVAEDVGFKVGVLVHILEGYKVAEALKSHGSMPTTFSDWWSYKFEVYDAIPYNGALMREQGLIVSFNSDKMELARRMNLEASKAVKYGGVPPEEALKFVTTNPAIQLDAFHRLGSLEPGKDADFVVWSGDPLSVYSICEQTWVDGRKYFDREEDREMRTRARKQRVALVQKILKGKKSGK